MDAYVIKVVVKDIDIITAEDIESAVMRVGKNVVIKYCVIREDIVIAIIIKLALTNIYPDAITIYPIERAVANIEVG